jgi:hypothetical protein
MSPVVEYGQPLRIPNNDITCRADDVAEVQYVPDADDPNACYVCAAGLPQQRLRCPSVTKLIMSTPPKCAPLGNTHAVP